MNDAAKSSTEVPLASVSSVPVERLVLDRWNPRLTTTGHNATDTGIIAQLYRAEDLGELLQSIAANGYLDIEPLIVLAKNGNLTVLEGNRRLAALQLFREPILRDRIATRERIRITLPDIPDRHRGTLDRVSVYRVASREDARSFIGFKHINGAAKWDSYAKAKFAADWYRDGSTSLSEIARRIGDRHDTVKRMVSAIYVLEQAENMEIYLIEDRVNPRFSFSHLYTALSRAPYMRFLDLDTAWSRYDPKPNPVPDNRLKCLSEVLRWMYGSKEDDVQPVVQSQNPDIKNLGEVLVSAEGLAVLRESGSLTKAHESTQPADSKFTKALLRARGEIREASNSLRGFDGRDGSLVDIAEDISETAQAICGQMKKKMRYAATGDE